MEKALSKLVDRLPEADGGFRRRMAAGVIVFFGLFLIHGTDGKFLMVELFQFPAAVGSTKFFGTSGLVVGLYILVFALGRLVEIYSDGFIDFWARMTHRAKTGPTFQLNGSVFTNAVKKSASFISKSLLFAPSAIAGNCFSKSSFQNEIRSHFREDVARDRKLYWKPTPGVSKREHLKGPLEEVPCQFGLVPLQTAIQNLKKNIPAGEDRVLIDQMGRELRELSVLSSAIAVFLLAFASNLIVSLAANFFYPICKNVGGEDNCISMPQLPYVNETALRYIVFLLLFVVIAVALFSVFCLVLKKCFQFRETYLLQLAELALRNPIPTPDEEIPSTAAQMSASAQPRRAPPAKKVARKRAPAR